MGRGFCLALLAVVGAAGQVPGQQPSFDDLLKKMADGGDNPCMDGRVLTELENGLFDQADRAVEKGLNMAPVASGSSAAARAGGILSGLEGLSAAIDKTWPEEKRFHFQVVEVLPGIVVKMVYRNRATFSFFGIEKGTWQSIGTFDNGRYETGSGYSYDWFEIFPLHQGPADRVRFLAKFGSAGCGSGEGVSYYGYEWNPGNAGGLDEIIKREGAVSQFDSERDRLDAKKDPEHAFLPVGALSTIGSTITLPFCWFSSVDTWHNPSLCSAETYDLSGDRVVFVNTEYNRPDLVPIARVIEHAEVHDYPAVLAYCGSAEVARRIVRDAPVSVYGTELTIRSVSPVRKSVTVGDSPSLHFEVEQRGDRWLVVSFEIAEDQ